MKAAQGVLAVAVLTLLMGCQAGDPSDYTTIDDADALKTTTTEIKAIFSKSAQLASSAVDGGELRNGESLRDTTCGELSAERFKTLEIGGSFLVKGLALDVVLDRVSRAWEKEGWEVTVTDKDRVSLETTTSTDVDVLGPATLQEVAGDPKNIGVSLTALTGCLEFP